MTISPQQMASWCETLLAGRAAAPELELVDYLEAVPRLDSLADVPSGTPVAVRGDAIPLSGTRRRDCVVVRLQWRGDVAMSFCICSRQTNAARRLVDHRATGLPLRNWDTSPRSPALVLPMAELWTSFSPGSALDAAG